MMEIENERDAGSPPIFINPSYSDQLRAEGRPSSNTQYGANLDPQASYFNSLSGQQQPQQQQQQGFATSSTQPNYNDRSMYQQAGQPLFVPNAVPTYGVAQSSPFTQQQQLPAVDFTLPSVMGSKSAGPGPVPPVVPNVYLPDLPPAGPERPIPSRGRRASIGQLY